MKILIVTELKGSQCSSSFQTVLLVVKRISDRKPIKRRSVTHFLSLTLWQLDFWFWWRRLDKATENLWCRSATGGENSLYVNQSRQRLMPCACGMWLVDEMSGHWLTWNKTNAAHGVFVCVWISWRPKTFHAPNRFVYVVFVHLILHTVHRSFLLTCSYSFHILILIRGIHIVNDYYL